MTLCQRVKKNLQIIQILVKCPKGLVLEVESIDHWRDGKTGKYFSFYAPSLSKVIGSDWGGPQGTYFAVTQEGSMNGWTGEIIVWNNQKQVGGHGRRRWFPAAGQFKVGDKIKFLC